MQVRHEDLTVAIRCKGETQSDWNRRQTDTDRIREQKTSFIKTGYDSKRQETADLMWSLRIKEKNIRTKAILFKPGSLAPPGHKINSGERFVIKLYFESVFPTQPAHNVRTLSPSSLPFPSTRGQDFLKCTGLVPECRYTVCLNVNECT